MLVVSAGLPRKTWGLVIGMVVMMVVVVPGGGRAAAESDARRRPRPWGNRGAEEQYSSIITYAVRTRRNQNTYVVQVAFSYLLFPKTPSTESVEA